MSEPLLLLAIAIVFLMVGTAVDYTRHTLKDRAIVRERLRQIRVTDTLGPVEIVGSPGGLSLRCGCREPSCECLTLVQIPASLLDAPQPIGIPLKPTAWPCDDCVRGWHRSSEFAPEGDVR